MCWAKFDLLRRWLLPAALLSVTPKCGLCLLAYAGLGTMLGFGGPELCGATESVPPATWLATMGALLAIAAFIARWVAPHPVTVRP